MTWRPRLLPLGSAWQETSSHSNAVTSEAREVRDFGD